MRWLIVAGALVISIPAAAQVYSRPTDPPIVSAENDAWYRLGEPVVVSGEFYYPAGPITFFNGNVMVRVGHYNGVPLYANTTLEPHSIVFVPIGRNQMQPYERLRTGDLAGTSGSRLPSFPGGSDRLPYGFASGIAAIPSPAAVPQPVGTISAVTPERAVGTTGINLVPVVPAAPVRGKPFTYDSVSVQFMGEKWVMAGPSMEMPPGLVRVAEYKGFPVYAQQGQQHERIYLPLIAGRVAPFTPKR
jgi:hypothetical protein